MIRDLRLGLQLLRGGGRAGSLRLLLMAVGTAVAVTAVLMIAQMPGILADRDHVIAARQPIPVTGERHASDFDHHSTQISWAGEPLTRVFIAASSTSPVPPGLERNPGAGETVLSPRAARLLQDDRFRSLVPGRVVATIRDVGLVDPEELVAYVGVNAGDINQPSVGTAWGAPAGVNVAGTRQFSAVALELSLLIIPATLIYLVSCARLAAATRRRRYAALSLVGTSAQTLRRIAFSESLVASLAGCLIGLGVFAAVDGPMGRAGVIGIRWFPERQSVDPLLVVALFAVAVAAARAAASASSRRASIDPLAERRSQVDGEPRWWMLLPLVLGVGLLLPWLPIGEGREVGDDGAVVVGAAILCTAGLLLAARFVVHGVAQLLTTPRVGLGVRIGARRLQVDSTSAVRLVAGLALLVLVSGIGTGLVLSAEQSAASELKPVKIHVYGSDVLPEQRDALQQLGQGAESWMTVNSIVANDPTSQDDGSPEWAVEHLGVRVLLAPCEHAGLAAVSSKTCQPDQLYRVHSADVAEPSLPAGIEVSFRRDGAPWRITTPTEVVTVEGNSAAATSELVYTGTSVPGGWADDSTYFFVVPPGLESLDHFSSELARVAPTATANASVDLEGVTNYRVHRDVLTFGTTVAFLLGALAALIGLVDRSIDRRRLVVDLVVLGTPIRTIRVAQIVFAAVPMLVLGLLAALVGWLVANVVAAADTGAQRWLWEPLTAEAPLVLLGLVATVVAGLVVVGSTPRAQDLRHE